MRHHDRTHAVLYNIPEHGLVLGSIVLPARRNVGGTGDRLKMMVLAETGEGIVLDCQGDMALSHLARSAHPEVLQR